VGDESGQAVHNPVDLVPGQGEHVENAVSDSASSPGTSLCDYRAILQCGGNRAEECLRADAEESPVHTLRRSTRPRKPVDGYGVVPCW